MFARYVVAAILVLSVIATSSTAASAGSTTTRQRLSDAERDRLCARAVREVEESRKLLADYEARLETARRQLAAAAEKDALRAEEVRTLEAQVGTLERLVANQKRITEALEDQVRTLTEDNTRVRGERDSARRQRWLWGLGGAIAGALLVVAAGGGE